MSTQYSFESFHNRKSPPQLSQKGKGPPVFTGGSLFFNPGRIFRQGNSSERKEALAYLRLRMTRVEMPPIAEAPMVMIYAIALNGLPIAGVLVADGAGAVEVTDAVELFT